MQPPLPQLKDYGLSEETGFLPEEHDLCAQLPLQHLYGAWETLARDAPALRLCGRLRTLCDQLPILQPNGLKGIGEQRRAFSILGFLAHAYVWGEDGPPCSHLPPGLAVPWVQLAQTLEVPPVMCYAACVLWNWHPIFRAGDERISLHSIATDRTFTGSTDESWFYLVSVAIEARGGPCLQSLLHCMHLAREADYEGMVATLADVAEDILCMTNTLARMYEHCDPHSFFYGFRPFLAGWQNMRAAGLEGVVYGGVDEEVPRVYAGGSNAQSSLIQAMDLALGVKHHPTGSDHGEGKHGFISEMQDYMPGPHRRFLQHVEQVACIRAVVQASESTLLADMYSLCVERLADLRATHLQIVARYIVVQSMPRETEAGPQGEEGRTPWKETVRRGLSVAQEGPKRGTGGTQLIPFLKQARDETHRTAVNPWNSYTSSPTVRTNESRLVMGLAAQWAVADDVGGICQY